MFEFLFKYPIPVFTKGKYILLGAWPGWVLLLLAVGVPAESAELDAEGIEHHVSDTTLAAFARFLGGKGT